MIYKIGLIMLLLLCTQQGCNTGCVDCYWYWFSYRCSRCTSYYYYLSSYDCHRCEQSCLRCNGGSASNCIDCSASHNRSLSSGKCVCFSKHYPNGVACSPCHSSCASCNNGTSCNACISGKYLSTYCYSCSGKCKTCTAVNDCTSCNSNVNRIYNRGTKRCDCLTKHYDNGNSCASCHYSCAACSGPSKSQCISCSSSKNRLKSGSSCLCKDQFRDDGTNENCQACNYKCRTCPSTSNVCATYGPYRDSTSCGCIIGYYDDLSSYACQKCHYSCFNCTCIKGGTLNDCSQCNSSHHRTLKGSKCLCNNHYFDNGTSICKNCHYSCLTCSNNTREKCLSCNSTKQRQLFGNSCVSQYGYYDDGSQEQCLLCPYNCEACTSPTVCTNCTEIKNRILDKNNCICKKQYYQLNQICVICAYYCRQCTTDTICTVCNNLTDHRSLNNISNKCECINRYYDDGYERICHSCRPECNQCTDVTHCVSCDASRYRELNSINKCPCMEGYYEDNSDGECKKCKYFCQKCTNKDVCSACNSSANRRVDPNTLDCLCIDGYFDDGIHEECQRCSYACKNCVQESTKCTECVNEFRDFNSTNNWCECKIGFYNKNQNLKCEACHYGCQHCNNQTHCLNCDGSKNREYDGKDQLCVCKIGYFSNTVNQACQLCDYKCKSCSIIQQCQTCESTNLRSFISRLCPCNEGYFDNGQPKCQKCHFSCKTCINITQCDTCESATNFRQYDQVTKLCRCIKKYFDDDINQHCLSCSYSCETCQKASNNCTLCNATAYRESINIIPTKGGACQCLQYYFDDGSNQLCKPCHYSCSKCLDNASCTNCNLSKFRESDNNTSLCKCVNGYFDDGNNSQQCAVCNLTCETCLNTVKCQSCSSSRFRIMLSTAQLNKKINPYCGCMNKYYSLADNNICEPCHFSCQVCKGQLQIDCLHCNNSAMRMMKNSKCLCSIGFFDNNKTEQCQNCHESCYECFGQNFTSCSVCNSTNYFLKKQTGCYTKCPEKYFEVVENMICQFCETNCLHCTSTSNCTECIAPNLLHQGNCLQQCPLGTYSNITTKVCIVCKTGCKNCTSDRLCSSCNKQYFLDSTLSMCYSCHKLCSSCTGPGQRQCKSCNSPLVLNKSTCYRIACKVKQFVDPIQGCKQCSSQHQNSITCNFTHALKCQKSYILKDGVCFLCSDISGYKANRNGRCITICGDGMIINEQCDDGNKQNGDGCSKKCKIEKGWNCQNSQCQLKESIGMSLDRIYKHRAVNQITIYLKLSLPVKLLSSFQITISNLSSGEFSYDFFQTKNDYGSLQLSLKYTRSISKKTIKIQYNQNQPNRLLSNSPRVLQISISFQTKFEVQSFPPAQYYPEDVKNFYTGIQICMLIFSLFLLAISLIIIPGKMGLYSLTFATIPAQIYILFVLSLENFTEWVQYSLDKLRYASMIGGFSVSQCCEVQGILTNYTTDILKTSGFVLVILIVSWIVYFTINVYHHYIKISNIILYVEYYMLALHLVTCPHLFYAGMNSIIHNSLTTTADSYNTLLALFLIMTSFGLVIFTWVFSCCWFSKRRSINQVKVEQIESPDSKYINELSESPSRNSQKDQSTFTNINSSKLTNKYSSTRNSFVNQENIQIQGKILKFDYIFLYKKQGWAHFFLPITITKIYVSMILASTMKNYSVYFVASLILLQIIYLGFLLKSRPFLSIFSNVRIIFISIMFLSMECVLFIFVYQSQFKVYMYESQLIISWLALITIFLAVLFCIVEHYISLKNQCNQLVSKLRGKNNSKVHSMFPSPQLQQKQSIEVFDESDNRSNQSAQDAFYARIIKKHQKDQDRITWSQKYQQNKKSISSKKK